jgi:hypothetical protein
MVALINECAFSSGRDIGVCVVFVLDGKIREQGDAISPKGNSDARSRSTCVPGVFVVR